VKICLLTNLYDPFIIGGAEVYVQRIARQLALHHEVLVITTHPFAGLSSLSVKRSVSGNVVIYSFFPLNFFHCFYAKRKPAFLKVLWHVIDLWNVHAYMAVFGILRREKPDVVHTHNVNGLSLSVGAAVKVSKTAWVHTTHDFSFLCPMSNLHCPLHGRCCDFLLSPCAMYRAAKRFAVDKGPDVIVFPSSAAREIFMRRSFFLDREFRILPYCTDAAGVAGEKTPPGDAGFNILYAGQLMPHKGVDVLIEAFKRLKESNIRLHIAGAGVYEGELRRLAGSDSRIVFYGKLDYDRLRSLYRLCDFSVVPSVWPEVLGIVVLESLSQGTPVIASAIGGIPEIVRDGETGILVPPNDAGALYDAIKKCISDPCLRDSMAVAARKAAAAFVIEEHTRRLCEIYEFAGNKR
jgi:glycosyltransferase involved in cell wall biosynthesis